MKGDSQPGMPLGTIWIIIAHASVASSKPKVELNSHANTCVVGDNSLIIHDHNKPVNAYSYDSKDGHRIAKTVDATLGYQDPQSGQKFILMINQAFCIDSLDNYLLCPMQCHLKDMHISDVPKFLAMSPSVTTYTMPLVDSFDAVHPLIIIFQV